MVHILTHRTTKRSPVKAVINGAKSTAASAASKLNMINVKPWTDGDDTDWWFAGTAVPLLAATIGPLANVLSIAALVTQWRMCLVDGAEPAACAFLGDASTLLDHLSGSTFADPRWCYYLNLVSLIFGVIGNIFLLFNFTGFIRYIIALPLTIVMWYLATGILIAITTSMDIHVPPLRPQQTYSQGFWYAVLAAIMYLIASMLLMVNMLGYFLGHYPQEFELTESQRTLILQTMLFFIWLASGGAIFAKVEQTYGDGNTNWSYVNSLYFSDVTILTVGFGDLSPTSSAGRGLVFPYSVAGTIMLGLVISSISRFATELGSEKVVDKRRERTRIRTVDRVVSSPEELHRLRGNMQSPQIGSISGPSDPVNNSARLRIPEPQNLDKTSSNASALTFLPKPLRPNQKPRPLLLRDEKDRFRTMRRIQLKTRKYKQWTGLMLSIFSFCVLWLLGALVFFFAESQTQGLTYFEALYFCYVSLLTIGYGDLAPKSNLGRPFFVLWSLIAVPTMTILISAMGDTVIQGFKKGVEKGAEVTILPRRGVIGDILKRSGIIGWIEDRKAKKELEDRRERGFDVGPDEEQTVKADEAVNEVLNPAEDTTTAGEDDREPSEFELATRLALAIQRVAMDLRESPPKRYEYDEWLEFTTLIKFTNYGSSRANKHSSEEEGLIEWDWIGEDSPMMAKQSEPEFVLDRLCESMSRYIKRQAMGHRKEEKDTGAGLIEAGGAMVEEDEDVTSLRRVVTSGHDTQSDTDTAVPPS